MMVPILNYYGSNACRWAIIFLLRALLIIIAFVRSFLLPCTVVSFFVVCLITLIPIPHAFVRRGPPLHTGLGT